MIIYIFNFLINVFVIYLNHKWLFTFNKIEKPIYQTIGDETIEIMTYKRKFKFSNMKNILFWFVMFHIFFVIGYLIHIIYNLIT